MCGETRTHGSEGAGRWQHRPATRQPLSFSELRTLSELEGTDRSRRMPVWITNATTRTRAALDFRYVDLGLMDQFRFEIGPYSFGSPQYGHVQADPERHGITPLDAMAASQAFLDPRQRTLSESANYAANVGLEALSFDWTVPIPNYRLSHVRRDLTAITPAPFHFATRFDETNLRSVIHLGDGGVSRDTLGIISLLERRTENIILLDQTSDVAEDKLTVNLQTLCEVNTFLVARGYNIRMIGHPTEGKEHRKDFHLNEHCQRHESGPMFVKNPMAFRAWKKKVWRGEIETSDRQKLERDDLLFETNLYVIKSVMDTAECDGLIKRLDELVERFSEKDPSTLPPATLCGWLEKQDSVGLELFPQHSIVALTGNTSWSLSMAHTDLGWYLAGDLEALFTETSD